MADVFLSYRRDDSRSASGRLMDHLQMALGTDRVFRDVDSIAPGLDFMAALERAIAGASVLLAVVGPKWLDLRDGAGRRRLDDPADMVRRELETALAAGVPVIPILVEGARMPAAEALPASLAAFARCQAFALDDDEWGEDIRRLLAVLRERHAVEPGNTAASIRERTGTGMAALMLDVLELVARPRRIILRLAGTGGTRELQRAAVLLLFCLALGNVFIGSVLEVGLPSWVFNGTLLGVLGSAGLAGAISLGWRAARVRPGWQRVTAGAACIIGGAWLYLSAGLLLVALGFATVDPGTFRQLLELMREGGVTHEDLNAMAEARARGPALAAIVVATVVWLAGAVWIVRAWNALRVACSAGSIAAVVAAAVAVGVVAVVVETARWAAT
jgi:hypothetical protein